MGLKISNELRDLITQEVLKVIYPVGSIYLSINTTNPSSYLGGTWELLGSGKYLMSYDPNNKWFDTPGSSSGSNDKNGNWNTDDTILNINQIPVHNHGSSSLKGSFELRGINNSDDNPVLNATGKCSVRREVWSGNHDVFERVNVSNRKVNWVDIDVTHTHSNNGGGLGHNHFHVSPYIVVCVWRRTK